VESLMLERVKSRIRSLRTDVGGGVMVFSALAMTATVGGAALAIDIGAWYNQQRNSQKAADAAAVGGVMEVLRGNNAGAVAAARAVAQRNGYATGGAVTVTVNRPPATGPNAGNARAVEVRIASASPRLLSAVMQNGNVSINVRSVALAGANVSNVCVLALDPNASGALNMTNFSLYDFGNCVPAANSTSNTAINATNFSELRAPTVYTPGDVRFQNYSTLDLDQPPMVDGPPIADPYANLAQPSPGGCNWNNRHVHSVSTATIGPGVYCNGLRVNNISDLTLQPGTYYIDRGDLDFSNISRIRCSCPSTGDGVTFVLTSTAAVNQIGRVNLNNISDISLSAPTAASGQPYPNMVFYQDRRATSTPTTSFTNISKLDVDGVYYFPNTRVDFNNNSQGTPGGCTVMIAQTFNFSNQSSVVIDECASRGIPLMSGGSPVRLVE
jgi:hypothetical protein